MMNHEARKLESAFFCSKTLPICEFFIIFFQNQVVLGVSCYQILKKKIREITRFSNFVVAVGCQ
jgi:hypothetical protein